MLISLIPGTLDNPIIVRSFGDEQFGGCTGYPADSHVVKWLVVRPRSHIYPYFPPRPFTILPLAHQLESHLTPSNNQMSRARPVERCPECGNVLKMEYVGPPDDPHAHRESTPTFAYISALPISHPNPYPLVPPLNIAPSPIVHLDSTDG